MRALVDSSVLLRMLFGEPDPLREWAQIRHAYCSRILLVEVGRTVDRSRLEGRIDDEQVAHLQVEAARVLRSVRILDVSDAVLARAAGPMPTVLGSLDAIHLSTALLLAPRLDGPLWLATHDRQLGRAARASGLRVVGAGGGAPAEGD